MSPLRMSWIAFPVVALPLFVPSASRAETIETVGRLSEVTVYQGQALVTREVDVEAPAGAHEVIVTQLPEHVVPNSLYAETADGVEVRSVRYRLRPVDQDVRDDVHQLDDQIQALADELEGHRRKLQVLADQKSYLAKLEEFVAPTSRVELTQGVLNADTLKSLSEFLQSQREQIAGQQLAAERDMRKLEAQLDLLARQRAVLANERARNVHEAVVFVELRRPSGKLRVRYLVNQATWHPSYNVRARTGAAAVVVEYNASIQQMSGEDWTDVAMSLSTASPSLVARAPVLEPLVISLTSGAPVQLGVVAQSVDDFRVAERQLNARLEQAARDRSSALGRQAAEAGGSASPRFAQEGAQSNSSGANAGGYAYFAKEADSELNSLARELQVLELIAAGRKDGERAAPREAATEGMSVSYALANRATLPSRADQQLVQIARMDAGGEFYRVAAPVLTSFVYREARLINDGPHALLAGPVTTYVDEQFVGRGDLPSVAVGQRFTVGLGIDGSLRATRELAAKEDSIQGGNRVTELVYALRVENFGDDEVAVRLIDRMPTAKDAEVKLTLVSDDAALSSDAEYQQSDRKQGILRWDVTAPAKRLAHEALTIDYTLRLEYDKQLAISGLPLRQ